MHISHFTSDMHYGHVNIIGFCGHPFANVETMNAVLIAELRATSLVEYLLMAPRGDALGIERSGELARDYIVGRADAQAQLNGELDDADERILGTCTWKLVADEPQSPQP